MKLATIRTGTGTTAVRVDEDAAVELGAAELGEFLTRPDWRAAARAADGPRHDLAGLDYAAPVPRPEKWLQGKTFERSTPVGPWLVTDVWPGEISCAVDGDVVQKADTSDLVFGAADLVAYLSQIITLVPGDLIATGTPGGVGHARKPPRYLAEGAELVTRVEGVGELPNTIVKGN